MLIIMYRCDARPPEIIFKEGFQPKSPTSFLPLYSDQPFSSASDSIAISLHFSTTAAFPMVNEEGKKRKVWIYLVAVDTSKGKKHYVDLHSKSLSNTDDFLTCFQGEWPKEHIVSNIHGSYVLSAFPVKRFPSSSEIESEQRYTYEYFKILGVPSENKSINGALISNPQFYAEYVNTLYLLTEQIGYKLKIPRNDTLSKEVKLVRIRNFEFFTENRFRQDIKKVILKPISIRIQDKGLNIKFLESFKYTNSDGLFFSSRKQLYQHNLRFFTDVLAGLYNDEQMKPKSLFEITMRKIVFFFNKDILPLESALELPREISSKMISYYNKYNNYL